MALEDTKRYAISSSACPDSSHLFRVSCIHSLQPVLPIGNTFYHCCVTIIFLFLWCLFSCVNSTFDNVNDSMFRSMDYYYSAAYQHKCYSIVDKYEYNKTEKCTSWHFDKTYYQSTLTEDVSSTPFPIWLDEFTIE